MHRKYETSYLEPVFTFFVLVYYGNTAFVDIKGSL